MRTKLIIALLVTILLSFATWSQRGAAANETAGKYEYQVILDNQVGGAIKQLNDLGAAGWELVGAAPHENNGMTTLYLKRTRK